MTQVVMTANSSSLDGFIAGPDDGAERPLGVGGERLYDWYFTGGEPLFELKLMQVVDAPGVTHLRYQVAK